MTPPRTSCSPGGWSVAIVSACQLLVSVCRVSAVSSLESVVSQLSGGWGSLLCGYVNRKNSLSLCLVCLLSFANTVCQSENVVLSFRFRVLLSVMAELVLYSLYDVLCVACLPYYYCPLVNYELKLMLRWAFSVECIQLLVTSLFLSICLVYVKLPQSRLRTLFAAVIMERVLHARVCSQK